VDSALQANRKGEKIFAIKPFRAGLLSPAHAVLVVA